MNNVGTRKIETERLILRRFKIEDAEDMYNNWASDPEVVKFMTWPAHPNVDCTRGLLSEWIPQYENGDYFQWAIELKETGTVIGSIALPRVYKGIDACEVGYCIGRNYWGQGITAEALKAVLDYLFDVAGFNRVGATHDINNPNSGKVMQKAGMKYEGTHRGLGWNNQGICDEAWYAMLRCDREET